MRVRGLDDAPQEAVVADDDDLLLGPRADKVAHPPRPGDVLVLGRLKHALVAVPLDVALDLGPVEPRLREQLLGLGERRARVAGKGAALLQLREDDDRDRVGVG